MSEPILERLSRFTPNAGALDRDALLFAAGRSSARPNRGWKAMATLLASTQALTLIVLWPRPMPPERGLTASRESTTVPSVGSSLEGPSFETLNGTQANATSAHRRLIEPTQTELADDSVTLIDSGPPLKVFGPIPESLLN
jgi:hypothetical protein